MGKIFTISGFDGSGKTTQINLLRKEYDLLGYRTASIFDIKNDENYRVRKDLQVYYDYFMVADIIFTRFYLRSPKTEILQNKVMYSSKLVFEESMLAYELFRSAKRDAVIWFSDVISRLYDAGKVIIFDRYYYDEVAYRALYSLEMADLLDEYYNESIIIQPDGAFYLKLPIKEIYERNKVRDDNKTALFQSHQKINQLYNNFKIISNQCNINIVDASMEVNLLNNYLKKQILLF